MKSQIIEFAKGGRLIINCLATGEIAIQVDCGRGTMGVVGTPLNAAETNIALIGAIKEVGRR